jgi:acetolactate synthase-1/2/3 large subunit
VGEGGWSARAGGGRRRVRGSAQIPVATSFRCQDYVDNDAAVYAGHAGIGMAPALSRRIAEADVLLAVGGRLGDIPSSGYTLLDIPNPRQKLVHVHPDPDELGAVYQPALAIVSGLERFAAAVAGLQRGGSGRTWSHRRVRSTRRTCASSASCLAPSSSPSHERTARRLDRDAILTCGAGNFTVWAHRYYAFRRHPSQLAPRSGAMGYGFPAAIAAKAVFPARTVVCLAGDGDFLMTGQEMATAVGENLPVVVLVINNGMYGTIRMHQERHFPGRVVGTDLVNPDFAAYARAFGAHGAVVERTEDFEAAFEEALGAGRPALLELRVDREAITPRQTLSEIRETAR